MNLILLFEDDFEGSRGRVCLQGRRYDHIRKVHRAGVGDSFCVGVCGGKIGTGMVTAIDDEKVELKVSLDREPPSPLPVTLVLALPRPIVFKRIMAAAAAMGVKKIILFHSARVEKSYWKSPVLKEENLKQYLILGLEQARDTVLPEIRQYSLFKPFVEDVLPGLAKGTVKMVAHPESPQACPSGIAGPVTMIIGPEGGFVPYEMEQLNAGGFKAVHLGERILRVETAVPFMLAKLSG